jgi:hypothetical protein
MGAGIYVGKGLNRYSNVHIDDLVDLMLAIEKAPAASFFSAENGDASFKEIAVLMSRSLVAGVFSCSVTIGGTQKPTLGAWYRQWRVVSLNGTALEVADTGVANENDHPFKSLSEQYWLGRSVANKEEKSVSSGFLNPPNSSNAHQYL